MKLTQAHQRRRARRLRAIASGAALVTLAPPLLSGDAARMGESRPNRDDAAAPSSNVLFPAHARLLFSMHKKSHSLEEP